MFLVLPKKILLFHGFNVSGVLTIPHHTASLPQQSNYCNYSKPYQFFLSKFSVFFKTPKGKALPILLSMHTCGDLVWESSVYWSDLCILGVDIKCKWTKGNTTWTTVKVNHLCCWNSRYQPGKRLSGGMRLIHSLEVALYHGRFPSSATSDAHVFISAWKVLLALFCKLRHWQGWEENSDTLWEAAAPAADDLGRGKE